MTEDGRSTGMAAFCSQSLSFLQGWGHQDAQLDANTNSLSAAPSHPHIVWVDQTQVSKARPGPPTKQKQVLRCAQDDNSSFSNFAFFKEISHENVPGK
jgi:hypothetical protein